jgi:sulfite reductase (NADPH) flavoprotein alpha-component
MSEAQKPVYTRNNPYSAKVLVNRLETQSGSEKETRHFEIAIDPTMQYAPGDSMGILPETRPDAIEETLHVLGFTGAEPVKDLYGVEITLREALRTRLSIGKLMKSTVAFYAKATQDAGLEKLLLADHKPALEKYLWGREFIDIATEYRGAIKDPQEMFKAVGRLVPRLYSIASSQLAHPTTVYTIVRVVRYEAYMRRRQGVCSGQLGDRTPVGTVLPIFLHSNQNFRLPADNDKPIIMVGPGTGVAPFRAYLEQRAALGAKGKNWLIFGEQHAATDFLYRNDFEKWQKAGVLTKLDTAFSRDQVNKVYVQDRVRENATEMYAWLEQGAYFYVCGDAEWMAPDVEKALLDVIAHVSGCGEQGAVEYLAAMKKQKRYLRDIY